MYIKKTHYNILPESKILAVETFLEFGNWYLFLSKIGIGGGVFSSTPFI